MFTYIVPVLIKSIAKFVEFCGDKLDLEFDLVRLYVLELRISQKLCMFMFFGTQNTYSGIPIRNINLVNVIVFT